MAIDLFDLKAIPWPLCEQVRDRVPGRKKWQCYPSTASEAAWAVLSPVS